MLGGCCARASCTGVPARVSSHVASRASRSRGWEILRSGSHGGSSPSPRRPRTPSSNRGRVARGSPASAIDVAGASGADGVDSDAPGPSGRDPWSASSSPAPLDVDPAALPRHLAIIMDGNARWAEHRRLSVNVGHERGVDALRAVVRCCGAWGVPALTVYAFSHENWKRGRDEVDHLMALLERTLVAELPDLAREGVRVTVMGDVGMLTQNLRDAVRRAEDATRGNAKLRLNVALSYSARRDIVAAARGLAAEVAAGHLDAEDITERVISERLSSRVLPAGVREPDLLIRTSGEQRLSNFMLWEAAYAELYFAEELWPDFTEASLRDALRSYAKRQRRFGRRGYGDEWPTDTRADAETEGEG